MSVISSISARHMETWAMDKQLTIRINTKNQDRILNIVIMGKNIHWSFTEQSRSSTDVTYLKLTFHQEKYGSLMKKR